MAFTWHDGNGGRAKRGDVKIRKWLKRGQIQRCNRSDGLLAAEAAGTDPDRVIELIVAFTIPMLLTSGSPVSVT